VNRDCSAHEERRLPATITDEEVAKSSLASDVDHRAPDVTAQAGRLAYCG
jgi:hypothetical protein